MPRLQTMILIPLGLSVLMLLGAMLNGQRRFHDPFVSSGRHQLAVRHGAVTSAVPPVEAAGDEDHAAAHRVMDAAAAGIGATDGTDGGRPRLFRYQDTLARNATLPGFVTVSKSPRVLYFPALLSKAEAETLVALGKDSLAPSGVWTGNDDADDSTKALEGGGSGGGGAKTAKKGKAHGGPRHRGLLEVADDSGTDATAKPRKKKPRSGPRTSSGTRLSAKHPVVKAVDRRILDVFGRQFSGSFAERVQLLRYEVGEKYNGHLDSFGGIAGPYYKSTVRRYDEKVAAWRADGAHGKKPRRSPYVTLERVVTLLLYLAEVEEGGNTSLPYVSSQAISATVNPNAWTDADVAALPKSSGFRPGKDDPCDATRFFSVKPKVGAAVAFYSLHEDGTEDRTALHMGCPVLRGTKYVGTKWLMMPLPWPQHESDAPSK